MLSLWQLILNHLRLLLKPIHGNLLTVMLQNVLASHGLLIPLASSASEMIVYHVLGDGLLMSFAHFQVDRIRPYSRRTCKYFYYVFKMGNVDKFSQVRLKMCRYHQMVKLQTQLYTDTPLALIKQGLDPW